MAHRVFRLSIIPERAPEVRRVIDFDGRSTLRDVHDAIQRELRLNDDHLYAFYLSGRYFDAATEYGPELGRERDSRRAVLFRLGLRVGQELAYLFDLGDEHRHAIKVLSIPEVETALTEPTLVESAGEAPPQYSDGDGDGDGEADAGEDVQLSEHLGPAVPLAEAVLGLSAKLDELYEEDEEQHALTSESDDTQQVPAGPPPAIVSLLKELSQAALALASELAEDEEGLEELDEWSDDRELVPRLLELPLGLVSVGDFEGALAVARAFAFAAPEPLQGDIAIALAEAGRRDEALAQVESNLKEFPESCLTAIKCGAVFEALEDPTAAEASYRRALTLAEDEVEAEEAVNLLAGLLDDMGRNEEADALLAEHDLGTGDDAKPYLDVQPTVAQPAAAQPAVGRNDPCPCGSGKKYKKCHGS